MPFKQTAIGSTALAALLAGALYAVAVQAQPAPAPKVDPGSALYGQPEGEGAAKLATVAPPPIPTAADKLPVAKLKVPDGFKVEVFASGVTNARSLRIGDKGTVFVGSRVAGKVHAIGEKDGKHEVKVIASDLHRPNGVALHKGALYVAELSKVWRLDNIEDHIDSPPKPVLVSDQFPKDETHGWKFIAIGPDDKLYVPLGAPGNINMPQETHAQIRRMDLDGSNMEVIARLPTRLLRRSRIMSLISAERGG
jgi:glucose/arabinose dehydrogenase